MNTSGMDGRQLLEEYERRMATETEQPTMEMLLLHELSDGQWHSAQQRERFEFVTVQYEMAVNELERRS
jgi:hypothetical protein